MKRFTFITVLLLGLIVSCAPTATPQPQIALATGTAQIPTVTPTLTPTATSTPTLTPTATTVPTATSTRQPLWTPVKGGENLVQDATWEFVTGVRVADGKLVISAGDTYITPINSETYLTVRGDFAISEKIETKTKDFGGFSLFGALPQGEWWKGIKRIDVGMYPNQISVVIYTGTNSQPAFAKGFRVNGLTSPAEIQLRKIASQFIIQINGREIGRVDDPGLFESGKLYFGANVAPHNQLTIHSISALTLQGQESNIQVVGRGIPTLSDSAPPLTIGNRRQVVRSTAVNPAQASTLSISPMLWGTNYWTETWSNDVINRVSDLNLTVVRWGGIDSDLHRKTTAQIDRFIASMRASNTEPLIQVKLYQSTPQDAAAMVRYVNVERKYGVKYWAIGNEPDAWNGFNWGGSNWGPYSVERYNQEWRAFYNAMKQVDPSIVIVGPDMCCQMSLGDPAHDWVTPFLRANGDVVDVVSLHWYPFDGKETRPEVLLNEPERFGAWVRQVKEQIRKTTGRDIPFAVTETNLTWDWNAQGDGSAASVYAGIRLADVLGTAAQNQLYMLNVWSLFNDNTLSIIGSAPNQLRPTYYAMQAYANFGGTLVGTISNSDRVKVYASRTADRTRANVILVNKSADIRDFDLLMHLPAGANQAAVDLGSPLKYRVRIDGYAFASLLFDSNLQFIGGTMYSKRLFDASRSPESITVTVVP